MTVPLYREFCTTEELDLQYQPSRSPEKTAGIAKMYRDLSARCIEETRNHLGIKFGQTRDEYLDIYLPHGLEPDQPLPVFIFFHGGYWKSFSARDFAFVARGALARGMIVVVPNYGLMPVTSMAEIVAQARAAIAWTSHNIASMGGDPERIVVGGHSAGGHLTAMAALTDWSRYDLPKSPIRGALPISGLFDLSPFPYTFLSPVFQLSATDMRRNSPMLTDLPAILPPMTLAVGGEESSEFHRQSDDFLARLAAAGHETARLDIADCDHFTVILDLLAPHGRLTDAVARLTCADQPAAGQPSLATPS